MSIEKKKKNLWSYDYINSLDSLHMDIFKCFAFSLMSPRVCSPYSAILGKEFINNYNNKNPYLVYIILITILLAIFMTIFMILGVMGDLIGLFLCF